MFAEDTLIGDKLGVPRTRDEMKHAIETHYIIPAFRDGKITVDKLLDHVDVVLEWYVPSHNAIDFMNFIRLVLGEEPENSNPKSHYFLIDCIFRSEEVRPFFEVRNIDYDLLNERVLILATREFSKALTLDTELATPNGYIQMRNIKKGDMVISRTGKPTIVTSKSGLFFNNTYRITLADGRTIETSYNHDNIIWQRYSKHIMYCDENNNKVSKKEGKAYNIHGLKEKVMTTEDLYSDGNFLYNREITNKQRSGNEYKYYIPMIDKPIEFNACDFPIDPYTVGVILGDGSIDKNTGFTRITCHVDDFENYKKHIPYTIGKVYEKKDSNSYFFSILNIGKLVKKHIGTEIVYNKRIPKPLLTGSVEERIAVLQGLLDTDGSINKKGSITFTSTSIGLAEDVIEIVNSLGGQASFKERKTKSNFGKTYSVGIWLNNIKPFRHQRKIDRLTYVGARNYIGIKNIELIHSVPTQCITVDCETQSYVLKNGLLTHNSTLLGSMLVLYIAATGKLPGFGSVNYMLYVSDSMRNNVKTTMETIGSVYRESQYLQNVFEEARLVQDEVNFVRNPVTKKEIALYNEYVNKRGLSKDKVPGRMKRRFTMSGLGASTGGRGSREGLSRPQGIFFDDMLGKEEDANSTTILENIENTIESDMLPALSGNGAFALMAGTPYNKNDPAYKRIEDNSWLPIVFPKAEKMDETITEKTFRGVWADRHTFKKCKSDWMRAKRAQENGNPVPMRKNQQEYYLRISNDEDRMVPDSLLQWFDAGNIIQNAFSYNWYLTTDYTSTGSKGSDFSGAALWAVGHSGDWFLMGLTVRKLELEAQYNETFNMIEQVLDRVRWVEAGVEIDGQQNIHIFALKQMMTVRNTYFSFAKQKGAPSTQLGIRSRTEGGNKHWRFRQMLPMFQNRKIWFADQLKGSADMNELLEEIKYCTYNGFGSTHDDGIDLISMIGAIDATYPSKEYSNENPKPKKHKGMKPGGINAKIWNKKYEEDDSTAYDSYA